MGVFLNSLHKHNSPKPTDMLPPPSPAAITKVFQRREHWNKDLDFVKAVISPESFDSFRAKCYNY